MAKGSIERSSLLEYSLKAAAMKYSDENAINDYPLKEKYYEKFFAWKFFFLIIR